VGEREVNMVFESKGARFCNDELAEVVTLYPEHFLGVAMLPSSNSAIMMAEFERAIKQHRIVGASIIL
jgi:uncharacterized protein